MAEREPGTPWTTAELAEAAGVTATYIRRLLAEGRLSGRKVGRDWIISDGEAQRFIAERKARWH